MKEIMSTGELNEYYRPLMDAYVFEEDVWIGCPVLKCTNFIAKKIEFDMNITLNNITATEVITHKMVARTIRSGLVKGRSIFADSVHADVIECDNLFVEKSCEAGTMIINSRLAFGMNWATPMED